MGEMDREAQLNEYSQVGLVRQTVVTHRIT